MTSITTTTTNISTPITLEFNEAQGNVDLTELLGSNFKLSLNQTSFEHVSMNRSYLIVILACNGLNMRVSHHKS